MLCLFYGYYRGCASILLLCSNVLNNFGRIFRNLAISTAPGPSVGVASTDGFPFCFGGGQNVRNHRPRLRSLQIAIKHNFDILLGILQQIIKAIHKLSLFLELGVILRVNELPKPKKTLKTPFSIFSKFINFTSVWRRYSS